MNYIPTCVHVLKYIHTSADAHIFIFCTLVIQNDYYQEKPLSCHVASLLVYCAEKLYSNGIMSVMLSHLTSPPTASRQKVSVQEALASSTLRPNSSKASRIETSNPGHLFSENTLMRKPLFRVSTVTCQNMYVRSHCIVSGTP